MRRNYEESSLKTLQGDTHDTSERDYKREFAPQELPSQEVPKQSGLKTLGSITRIMLKNPSAFRKLRFMGSNETRYVRPPLQYEIPPLHKGMKCCSSHEPYLRPTRWCNPREPEVVAMASELGAYELSDCEFAEAAYWFVKTKMSFEICPFDSAGATLKRGTGSCYHLINVFTALCRSAGIKARYKNYKMRFRGIEQSFFIDVDPMMTELYELGGGVIAEGEGEACIGGKWTVAYVAAERGTASAAAGWPITKFGEDSIGMYFDALPGSVKRFESLPLQLGLGLRFHGIASTCDNGANECQRAHSTRNRAAGDRRGWRRSGIRPEGTEEARALFSRRDPQSTNAQTL